ncbi:hypothetical protein Tco_0364565 [Tanacetum coccineum]
MSETEPIPPTSSVTALRIPIIKKGEYDLWSMKMRQYIAITDHILWDIITNGNQTTTDPASPSVSAPKTSLAANARRNNEKALNILLSAIPDRHLLSFHDAVDARSLWKAIKARFGGNEASKKMQKNLLKQQFETFTIGSREELDSAYERFQHILSMLELHDATVSIEDANLKFLRSLPSVWHVVVVMNMMEFVSIVLLEMEHQSIFQLRTLLTILQVLQTILHNPNTYHTLDAVNSLIIGDEHLDTIPATELDKGIPDSVCDVPLCNNPTPLEAFKEHSETIINSNNDYSSSDDDSYENIDYVDASPPDAEIVSLEVVEIVIPEVGGIDTDILLTIKDDILREKLLNVNLLIANIEALKDNPTPSSDFVTKSSSTFPNSFLEETNTFDNSIPESETFCFDLEENSSGSTTTRSDYSLPDYEAFYSDDDLQREKSSGSTTTHADFSQYDSFIFDLSINPFPPADRSDFYHEEFADELAHIISPPCISLLL